MENLLISKIFRDFAKILEIKGDNPFRVRAYERAAQNIENLTNAELNDFIQEGRLREIPGIGEDLASKIAEIAATGRLASYEDLKKTIPEGVLDLINIPSVGPRTARLLYEQLKVKSIADLENAIKKDRLRGIFGIKERTIQNIRKGLELVKKGRGRMLLSEAEDFARKYTGFLKEIPKIKKISAAGSLRRQKETVRDIDMLVISDSPGEIMDKFVKFSGVADILAKGKTKSSIRTEEGVQIDCRVLNENSFGAALLYFTGSKNFNIKIRQLAIKKGLKVNEYGVFRGNKFVCGRSEEEIFRALGMAYIPPELREDSGEIELACQFKLPSLIELKDLKGDLHVHSRWSDGNNSIMEMASSAKERGYSYIAITDHSQSLKVARGLSIADLKKKKAEIDRINKKIKGLSVLYGTEVDIDSQGRIDYPDKVLKGFDVVVAAIHGGFKQPREQLTRRLVRACQNKFVHIIAHPTGRLFGTREAYDIDMFEVLKTARETNTQLEINAFPQRLDLNDENSRKAKEMGVKLAINTDGHQVEQLDVIKFGISVARRGWLVKEDVINTLPLNKLLKTIKK